MGHGPFWIRLALHGLAGGSAGERPGSETAPPSVQGRHRLTRGELASSGVLRTRSEAVSPTGFQAPALHDPTLTTIIGLRARTAKPLQTWGRGFGIDCRRPGPEAFSPSQRSGGPFLFLRATTLCSLSHASYSAGLALGDYCRPFISYSLSVSSRPSGTTCPRLCVPIP